MYSIRDYGWMLTDRVRMDAYVEALRRAMRPGSVVADIGTGLGYFAMLACKLGARRVYAIEPDDSIHVARQLAAQNGFDSGIEFIQKMSTEVELPERMDVIISDMRGVVPLLREHIRSIADARERLLKPGGVLIPNRDDMWAAVVQSPALYEKHVCPPATVAPGFDMTLARRMATNSWRKANLTEDDLLSPAQRWITLDYQTVSNPNCGGLLNFLVPADGTAHGFALWFDAELFDGVSMSNNPVAPEAIYGQAFFSFEEPVPVSAGTSISVLLQATLTTEYVWSWQTVFRDNVGGEIRRFEQSTFFGAPMGLQELHKRAATFVPTLGAEGEAQKLVLALMDGNRDLRDIAKELQARYPERFSDGEKALTFVSGISAKYSG